MDSALKKQVLRQFTYGLYIVMCADQGEVNGFTANWLTQVSFDPPLLAVSIENDARSLPMIQRSGLFTVNVLRSGQKELAGALGKSAIKHPHKMEHINYRLEGNYPILLDGLAWVACKVQQSVLAGDSTLIVAEITDVGILGEGGALTMAETGFRHAG